jgi:hypothetical protein
VDLQNDGGFIGKELFQNNQNCCEWWCSFKSWLGWTKGSNIAKNEKFKHLKNMLKPL